MYVTLEPCARRSERVYGPSCTERILEAGIARVVIGAADPSPFAAGEGSARLRAAGIPVEDGVLGMEAAELNRGHCQRVRLNRPFTRVKLAQTADGFAATPDRRPIAITGEEARTYVHRLRADADALVTGIGTVLADDPLLDVRLPGMADWSPLRVVLDTAGRIDPAARLVRDAGRVPVVIMTAEPVAVQARLAGLPDVEVLAIPRAGDRLDLAAAMGALAARGITRVLVEAGPTLADAMMKAGLCDELVLLTGPNVAGAGLKAIGPALADQLENANIGEERMIGPDRLQVFSMRNPEVAGS
ncbi:MAG: diaminohydroxyphosphoribosylaminopyrimidine [Beijerinckiaceae bacterium]|nr:MAG: diaminohydroxyphosphoribosylaminopyrimidine [Beijerinckiaceae bacterium]